ncbi:MAG TPA: glycosyltransferase [Bacteroidota bacterium]|nr:glycosyltransferase [Bacteroidota bacterium]
MPSDPPFVSILVAARNEEQTIGRCLDALRQQEYPKEKLEVIVVNDGSTDKTGKILEERATFHQNLRVLELPQKQTHNKAMALTHGVKAARGEVLLTTDADCVPSATWVGSMAAEFNSETALVAGPVIEHDHSRFIARLSKLEFLGLIATAAGLIGLNRPIICNGANLAFRKSAFEKAGGFGNGIYATEDEVLMNRIYERNLGAIRFAGKPAAIVKTDGPKNITDFLRQRIRWSSKRKTFDDRSILLFLVLLYLYFAATLAGAVLCFSYPFMLLPVGISFLLKCAVDASVLHEGGRLLDVPLRWSDFLIAELFHVPYIVVAAFLGQFKTLSWKGRTIR